MRFPAPASQVVAGAGTQSGTDVKVNVAAHSLAALHHLYKGAWSQAGGTGYGTVQIPRQMVMDPGEKEAEDDVPHDTRASVALTTNEFIEIVSEWAEDTDGVTHF